tara:strand:- start:533 stop:739 length:207 start_codon:yes stop_codon:yes gene_type:complete
MKNKLKDCYKELLEKLDLMEVNLGQIQKYVSELKKNHGCVIADMEKDDQRAPNDERSGDSAASETTEN